MSGYQDGAKLPYGADVCIRAIRDGKKILICGNGGSAAMASHFAAELIVRFKKNRQAIPCISLAADQSVITACANDFGYENVFSRQIEALGQPRDVLIVLTTSGKSENIKRAIDEATRRDMWVIQSQNPTLETTADRQETHLSWLHDLAQAIEECCG